MLEETAGGRHLGRAGVLAGAMLLGSTALLVVFCMVLGQDGADIRRHTGAGESSHGQAGSQLVAPVRRISADRGSADQRPKISLP